MSRRAPRGLAGWSPLNLALLAAAAVLVIGAAARVGMAALRPAAGVEAAQTLELPPVPSVRDALPETPPDAVVAAVASAPFRPERQPPPLRYSPEPERPGARRAPDTLADARRFRLQGVAASGRQRLAAIAAPPGQARAQLFQVGDSLGPFLVRAIAGDSVVLAGSDTTVVLKIVRPW